MPENHKLHVDFDLLDQQFGHKTGRHRLPLDVRIMRVNPLAKLPAYATAGSVGLDLQAMESRGLWPGRAEKIPCGIALALPDGYEAQIRPRSGLTAKGVHCGFGTCDSDFRGELCVVLTFHSESPNEWFTVTAGDRVAQLVIVPVPRIQWQEVFSADELGNTERGSSGFGSSGLR
jgi:dUTP pyrophosphatase